MTDPRERSRPDRQEAGGGAAPVRADTDAGGVAAAGEAGLALEAIRHTGLPAVVTLALPRQGRLLDGYRVEEACKLLADEGADVVGLNCFLGPATMLPALGLDREAVSVPVAGLLGPYRKPEEHSTFFSLPDPDCKLLPEGRTFPTTLEPFLASVTRSPRSNAAAELGITYLGLCCGAAPHYVRCMAESLFARLIL